MCSVRKRPIPSAPKSRAILASSGLSALVRTPILRYLSTIFMNSLNIGFSDASINAMAPVYTAPFVPLRVRTSPSLMTILEPLIFAVFVAASTLRPEAPTIQHLPHPRATRAACEVIPPRAVRIPSAARIPSTSSGLVSSRRRMTFSPLRNHATASSELKTTLPTAAPGPAGRPLTTALTFFSASGLQIG